MKPYKTFRQFLEERGFVEIMTTASPSKPPDQKVLRGFATAVQQIGKKQPSAAISGKDPQAQQTLYARLAGQGITPDQALGALAKNQAKANEPSPSQVAGPNQI